MVPSTSRLTALFTGVPVRTISERLVLRSSRFQFIRSHESVFIQLADVLMGAINYNLRYEKGEVEGRVRAKMKLIEKIKKHSNISLNTTTPKFRKKFNLFFIALK